MRQKDIERVMAAAWAVADGEYSDWDTWIVLREALQEIDPSRVYHSDAPQVPTSAPHDPYVPLRQSPRFIRPANEAGTHD